MTDSIVVFSRNLDIEKTRKIENSQLKFFIRLEKTGRVKTLS